jgi:hypothetical protein
MGDFFKPCPRGLRLGLKNRQVGEKWVSDDCSFEYFSQIVTALYAVFQF